jgi:trimeric autotransporter adhesin
MALVLADRVRETTTTTGTGSVTLAGAYTGFQTFSAGVGTGNSTYYTIANVGSGEWEVGIGSYTSGGNTLSRTTVLASSNSGSLVNFGAGSKDVFVTQPAERALYVASAGTGLESKVTAFTNGGIVYASSTSALATNSALTWNGSALAVTGTLSATYPASTKAGAVFGTGATTQQGWSLGNLASATSGIWSTADTPSTTNYRLWADASYTIQSGPTYSALAVAGSNVAVASSTGLAVTGTNALTVNRSSAQGQITLQNNSVSTGILIAGATNGLVFYDAAAGQQMGTWAYSAGLAVTGTFSSTLGATIQGLTVGLGTGAVATNTAVGASALAANTTGNNNTAVGYQSAYTNTTGNFLTALGVQSLYLNTTGIRNVAVGYATLSSNTTASYNTAVGMLSLAANTTGANNTALGNESLVNNTTASNNTAVGYQAGYANTTGEYLEAFGWSALRGNTTGVRNSAFGTSAMYTNTSGSYNIAMGFNALSVNTTGSNNVGLGYQSLYSNTTASNNTAVGYQAGYSTTTGDGNVFVGRVAGYSNTTGYSLVAMGNATLYSNTTGLNNVAIGQQALQANTTASNNTAVGHLAGYSNVTGTANVYSGYQAGYWQTGSNNAAYGFGALSGASGATGSSNVAVGYQALASNTTASNNTAVGYQAGYTNVTGEFNTFIGRLAGYTSTGGSNTFVGNGAGYIVSTGIRNTFVGVYNGGTSCGSTITTGSRNTIIGGYDGNQGGLDIRTASNYIVLSDGDGNPRMACNNSGTWNINVGGSGVNNPATLLAFYGGGAATNAGPLRFGDGSFSGGSTNYWDIGRDNNTTGNFTFTLNGTQKGYIATATGVYTPVSDRRSKKNIVSLQYGLSSVMAMNPVMYHMVEELDTDKKHIGLIAQEIKVIIDESVDDIKDEATQFYGLDKSGLVPVLIKAIQEQQALITTLTARITALEGASA